MVVPIRLANSTWRGVLTCVAVVAWLMFIETSKSSSPQAAKYVQLGFPVCQDCPAFIHLRHCRRDHIVLRSIHLRCCGDVNAAIGNSSTVSNIFALYSPT